MTTSFAPLPQMAHSGHCIGLIVDDPCAAIRRRTCLVGASVTIAESRLLRQCRQCGVEIMPSKLQVSAQRQRIGDGTGGACDCERPVKHD